MPQKSTDTQTLKTAETAWQAAFKAQASAASLVAMVSHYCGSPIPQETVHGLVFLLETVAESARQAIEGLEDVIADLKRLQEAPA